ncbi:hypothetical protein ROTO_33740 [Roseovarius tolerans]|uniref:Uncharacterized protein n=1 Tax=Roseovarius tolerans TaxID=74031 RepID=A0A0L6CR27_9RHOB|nr:hypothetical protein ROTO_33740 [Roseovarius tolerans]
MQHEHERFARGAVARPARQPPDLQRPGGQQGHAGRHAKRQCDPKQNGGQQGQKGEFVKPLHRWGRQPPRAAFDQPVAGKGGHDPPADHGDHQDRGPKAQPQPVALCRVSALRGLPVEEGVAGGKAREHHQHQQVTPVLACHDLAQDGEAQNDGKGQIDPGHKPRGHVCREGDRQSPAAPDQSQRPETPAHDRQTAGPVRHRGQEKSGDHRAEIAEQEFMGVPADRIECSGQHQMPRQHRHPKGHGQRRPDRRPEEERTEPIGQDGRTGPGPHLRGGCCGHCDAVLSVAIPASVRMRSSGMSWGCGWIVVSRAA